MLHRKLKVALVSEMYLPRVGGLELHVRDLARELNVRGHEAHVICNTPGPAVYEDGVKIHRLGLPRVPIIHTIGTPHSNDALRRLFEQEHYDIIHTHAALLPMTHVANFVARKLGLPSVLTECSWLGAGWLRFFRSCHRASRWGHWPTFLSGVSRCVADQLAAITGRDDVFVLHNGVRVENWTTVHREPQRPVVVSVMRFTQRKRPIDVVRAIPYVHARLPEPLRPRFLLIGDGRERARVVREAARLGVSQHLELPGFLDRTEIRRRFEESSVFVLPTEREAMSIVCAEALSAGLPVVAMNKGGVSDVVADQVEGFLCSNATEFADRIVELIADADLRRRMALQAPTRVARFSWDGVIQRHLNVFELAIRKTKQLPTERLDRYGMIEQSVPTIERVFPSSA
jgi:glycosyltransferase involved in cell wall biosynthesis